MFATRAFTPPPLPLNGARHARFITKFIIISALGLIQTIVMDIECINIHTCGALCSGVH